MSAIPPPDPRVLELIDEVLESIGNAIHDGPVQDIVVAKLLSEVLVPSTGGDDLGDKTIKALGRANTHSRRLMWALSSPQVRQGHVAEDLPDLIAAADGTTVRVEIAENTPHDVVVEIVRALHRVVAGAALADRAIASVIVRGDAVGVECEVVVDGAPPPHGLDLTVWERLAAARLEPRGGSVGVAASGSWTLIRLELAHGVDGAP